MRSTTRPTRLPPLLVDLRSIHESGFLGVGTEQGTVNVLYGAVREV